MNRKLNEGEHKVLSTCPSKEKERTNIKGRCLEKEISDFIKYMVSILLNNAI
jgi:hypothetical protein